MRQIYAESHTSPGPGPGADRNGDPGTQTCQPAAAPAAPASASLRGGPWDRIGKRRSLAVGVCRLHISARPVSRSPKRRGDFGGIVV